MVSRKKEWLGCEYFRNSPMNCARGLIGCELVWDGCSGVVMETEAYAEFGDEACHTFRRKSAREFVQNHDAGAAYIYLNYGMYWLANILVKGGPENGFVLLRGLWPKTGVELMRQRRGCEALGSLCSGPGKLTIALGIRGEHHGEDWCSGVRTGRGFLQRQRDLPVEATPRIGISKAVDHPWRFVVPKTALPVF